MIHCYKSIVLKHWTLAFLYKEILLPRDTHNIERGLTSLAQLWKPRPLSKSVRLMLKADMDLIKGFDVCNMSSGCVLRLILSMYAVEMLLSSSEYLGNKLN